ncbi:MAG TPA: hypothetical protein VL635_13885 [Trinickia sp.]|nr:hypothetical protein [Trinickia sp.]
MQHTVIAFFDTYPQAEAARDALVAAGIAYGDVALKARCEPTYASDATSAAAGAYERTVNEGLLASIERFFESLFASAPPEREAARYAEAVRRGAVMVCVDAPTDAMAQVTRITLEGMGPLDVEERAATWRAPADEATRAHSALEELGLRTSVPAQPVRHGTVHSYGRDSVETPVVPSVGETATEAAATAVAAGSAPGMGAVFTAGRGSAQPVPDPDSAPSTPPRTPPSPLPDEYLQDEEVYRGDDSGAGRT